MGSVGFSKGDNIIITPVLKRLKELGYHITVDTSERGEKIFRHNPNIDEIIVGVDNSKPPGELVLYWDKLEKDMKPDKFINFSESIECTLAIHPAGPLYVYPKKDRYAQCDKNYYDFAAEWAKVEGCQKLPEMFYTPEEE